MDELKRLEALKEEAVANPPKKAKGGCKSCKKKKDAVTEVVLPNPYEFTEYIPTLQEIRLAYLEMNNNRGISTNAKSIINKVYTALFKEEFDFDCRTCVSKQVIKYYNYCKERNYL